MRFRLLVKARTVLGDRILEKGDVLSLETKDNSAVVAAQIPWNPGAVLGLLSDGTCDPIELSHADVIAALRPSPPPRPTRVLPFRARRPA
jgi:hypothetical protein